MPYEFRIRRRVHFQDTDTAGIIHFASYFRYMEEVETEFLFHLAELAGVVPGDAFFIVPRVAVSAEFLSPVRFGAMLDILIRCTHKGRSSIGYAISFRNGDVEAARAQLKVVCVTKNEEGELRPIPIPKELDAVLEVAPSE
ncbi:MAG: acyl-CoA thioesterase [Bryobacterales bacterium]|nr:acyl-CoA thioesterase [Acidobacteriota bacterium]MCB9385517.1 acyl-CoA thioesterase [Bryobacterales bacterium]